MSGELFVEKNLPEDQQKVPFISEVKHLLLNGREYFAGL